MLVRFTSPQSASVSMFEKDATQLIKMMGHSGTIPSAIRAEDIPTALQQLDTALHKEAAQQPAPKQDDDEEENHTKISTNVRAYPLIQLLKDAHAKNKAVMWEYDHAIM